MLLSPGRLRAPASSIHLTDISITSSSCPDQNWALVSGRIDLITTRALSITTRDSWQPNSQKSEQPTAHCRTVRDNQFSLSKDSQPHWQPKSPKIGAAGRKAYHRITVLVPSQSPHDNSSCQHRQRKVLACAMAAALPPELFGKQSQKQLKRQEKCGGKTQSTLFGSGPDYLSAHIYHRRCTAS